MSPKVLVLDIETTPLEVYSWTIRKVYLTNDQILKDWTILAWAAKWLHDPESKIMYEDQRKSKDIRNDKQILKIMWKLLNEADIIITKNGSRFDIKKLNARFLLHGFKPVSPYRHIDIEKVIRRIFGFTSNKLDYLSEKLNKKYKKLKHEKFPGLELWKQCLSKNIEAFKELEKYNKYDVLSTEELYNKVISWDENSINFNLYRDATGNMCKCGSTSFASKGFKYTSAGKYRRYTCKKCGAYSRDKLNLFNPEKRKSLRS